MLPLIPLAFLPFTSAHPFRPSRRPEIPTNPPPSLCGRYPLPYCAGTNYTLATPLQRRLNLCGDSRLGPITLPDLVLPLDSVFDIYARFGTANAPSGNGTRICAAAFLDKWWNGTLGRFNYPAADGYTVDELGAPIKGNVTLQPGVLIDRFGGEGGTYLSPAGAPFLQRALPPGNLGIPEGSYPVFPYNYHVYRVNRPLPVRMGPIAPWFGQPGQGVQYELPANVSLMVAWDYLKRVDPRDILREEGNGRPFREGGGRGGHGGRGRDGDRRFRGSEGVECEGVEGEECEETLFDAEEDGESWGEEEGETFESTEGEDEEGLTTFEDEGEDEEELTFEDEGEEGDSGPFEELEGFSFSEETDETPEDIDESPEGEDVPTEDGEIAENGGEEIPTDNGEIAEGGEETFTEENVEVSGEEGTQEEGEVELDVTDGPVEEIPEGQDQEGGPIEE